MREPQLRRLHRLAGIVLAPLLVLQALSGVLLSVDWLLGIHRRFGESVGDAWLGLARLWDAALVEIHYGKRAGPRTGPLWQRMCPRPAAGKDWEEPPAACQRCGSRSVGGRRPA